MVFGASPNRLSGGTPENCTRGRVRSPASSALIFTSTLLAKHALSLGVSFLPAFDCDQADVVIKIGSRGEGERFLEDSFEELIGW